jgi:hypothetical protein
LVGCKIFCTPFDHKLEVNKVILQNISTTSEPTRGMDLMSHCVWRSSVVLQLLLTLYYCDTVAWSSFYLSFPSLSQQMTELEELVFQLRQLLHPGVHFGRGENKGLFGRVPAPSKMAPALAPLMERLFRWS